MLKSAHTLARLIKLCRQTSKAGPIGYYSAQIISTPRQQSAKDNMPLHVRMAASNYGIPGTFALRRIPDCL